VADVSRGAAGSNTPDSWFEFRQFRALVRGPEETVRRLNL